MLKIKHSKSAEITTWEVTISFPWFLISILLGL